MFRKSCGFFDIDAASEQALSVRSRNVKNGSKLVQKIAKIDACPDRSFKVGGSNLGFSNIYSVLKQTFAKIFGGRNV